MRRVIGALWAVLVLVLMVLVVNYASNEAMIRAFNNDKYEKNILAALGFTQPYISHYNQGNNYYQQGYYDLAIEEYDKALEYMVPEEAECHIRINKALSMTRPVTKNSINADNIKEKIAILRDAEDVLCENGCAEVDGKGHSKDAQQLVDDIEDFIDEIGVVVKFIKEDEKGNKLAEAQIQILDEEEKVLYEYVSTDTAYVEKGFKIGNTYIMREKKAPDGYQKAEDIFFTIEKDGTVSYEGKDKDAEDDEVIMIDKEADGQGGGGGGGETDPQPMKPGDQPEPMSPGDKIKDLMNQSLNERPQVSPTEYEYYDGEPW